MRKSKPITFRLGPGYRIKLMRLAGLWADAKTVDDVHAGRRELIAYVEQLISDACMNAKIEQHVLEHSAAAE